MFYLMMHILFVIIWLRLHKFLYVVATPAMFMSNVLVMSFRYHNCYKSMAFQLFDGYSCYLTL